MVGEPQTRLTMDESKPRDRQLSHREVAPVARTFPICLIADGIESAVNVGSLFRLADAFGVEKLFLTGGSPVPPNAKLRKTSRATERRVAHEARTDALVVIGELKASGYLIASLEVTAHAIDIRTFDRPFERLAVIVGAENSGVRQELLDASDLALRIPMFGQNSSLNLATACAISLFEITKRLLPP
jgi:tRNA G18 (ribose-2'-O)-methylase SpoU